MNDAIPMVPAGSNAGVGIPPRRRRFRRSGLWLGAVVLGCGFTLGTVAVVQGSSAPADVGPFQVLEHGAWRYTLHVPSGSEGLFDVENDPAGRRNLVRERPGEAVRLRGRLLQRLGAESVEQLREPYRQSIEALEGLGYL